jgi:hypothetical protein
MTTVFTPVSTGPRLTIPAGSTKLPVTSAAGFEVGHRIGIDVGGNYEVATVTAVGKPGTQSGLSAEAVAGATNIKVDETADLTAGDTLTVDTGGGKETVVVARVGTPGAEGTGVELVAPLRLDHRSGVDVSSPGTGISVSPATRFPHMSGDAVQALGSGVTLDRPLARAHGYGTPVVDPLARTAGYQGSEPPDQWFGGELSTNAGSIALLDAGGSVVVDAMVYGTQQSSSSANGYITSPEIATLEAVQDQGGCIVVVPREAGGTGTSAGRFPDGADADQLCTDFLTQPATTLAAASAAGSTNIKVASVDDFAAGQTVIIDTGADRETAVVATVGTPGATTVGTATEVGATVISVASSAGFSAGQTITIGSGENVETAVVASITRGGRGGFGGGRGGQAGPTVTVAQPLSFAHPAGAQVLGSGITLTTALTRAHDEGAWVRGGDPTPGEPNRY